MPYTYLICYDIPDDDRRSDVSDLLAAHGARVQYSVFEVTLPTKKDVQRLRGTLRRHMDRDEDQIRLCPLPAPLLNELVILGDRRLEERADYWILQPMHTSPDPHRAPDQPVTALRPPPARRPLPARRIYPGHSMRDQAMWRGSPRRATSLAHSCATDSITAGQRG